MPIEKTVSYKVKFDFTDAEKQAENFAKKHGASNQGGGKSKNKKNPQPPDEQQYSVWKTILYFLNRFSSSRSPINRIFRMGENLGFLPRNYFQNPFKISGNFGRRGSGKGGGGSGGGNNVSGGDEGGGGENSKSIIPNIPFAKVFKGGAGSLLLRGGLIGLAVAGVVIALKEVKDQFTNFAKGVGLITKSIVTGNTVSALHGLGHIGQAGASVAGMAIGGILGGPGGFLLGGYLGNKLGGLVHSLIDGLEGIVDALGKYSPIVNAQLAQFKVKQFMFSYQMAQVFQPLMSAWIKLKSFILDVLGAFGQAIRPLVQMAGNALSNFVDYLKLATIGIVNYLSAFLQNISPIVAALAPGLMGALNTVVNGLNKTAGILGRANNSLDDATSKFIQSFVTSILNYKNVVNPKAWLSTNQHLMNHPFGNMKQELLPGQDAFIARNYPLVTLSPAMQQNQANKNEMNDFANIHAKEQPGLHHGYQHPVTPATAIPPAAAIPPYIPGPTMQWQNSISNQFNLKVSMDEMVEKSIAEIRRELSHCHEESAAETTLASLLVTGAVKGLLV